MSFTQRFRHDHGGLWETMVHHPFVRDLGDGTLTRDRWGRYIVQDYLFLKDLSAILALAIADAPDFDAARRLTAFLSIIVGGEEDLFTRYLSDLDLTRQQALASEPLPTTLSFGSFLVRTAHSEGFHGVLACLSVAEGAYLDWAMHLRRAGKFPADALKREWIDIHASEDLEGFVGWVRGRLDGTDLSGREDRLSKAMLNTLRYEVRFWDMAYDGEAWPGS